jgi:hypothetical protein
LEVILTGNMEDDRRMVPRVKVDREVMVLTDVSLLDADIVDYQPPLTLIGRTRDLSLHGLSLVLPSIRADRRSGSATPTMTVILDLPVSAIAVRVAAVYAKPLNDLDPYRASIIGLCIEHISEHDYHLLNQYLAHLI